MIEVDVTTSCSLGGWNYVSVSQSPKADLPRALTTKSSTIPDETSVTVVNGIPNWCVSVTSILLMIVVGMGEERRGNMGKFKLVPVHYFRSPNLASDLFIFKSRHLLNHYFISIA